jgi:hypothetical protein
MRRCLFFVNPESRSSLDSVLHTAIVSEDRNAELGCACISVSEITSLLGERMLVFTSVSAVSMPKAPTHDPLHAKSGAVSRGLVIGWHARAMTWVGL